MQSAGSVVRNESISLMISNELPRPTENEKSSNAKFSIFIYFFFQMVYVHDETDRLFFSFQMVFSPLVSPSTFKHLVIQTTPFKPPSGVDPVDMQKKAPIIYYEMKANGKNPPNTDWFIHISLQLCNLNLNGKLNRQQERYILGYRQYKPLQNCTHECTRRSQ